MTDEMLGKLNALHSSMNADNLGMLPEWFDNLTEIIKEAKVLNSVYYWNIRYQGEEGVYSVVSDARYDVIASVCVAIRQGNDDHHAEVDTVIKALKAMGYFAKYHHEFEEVEL